MTGWSPSSTSRRPATSRSAAPSTCSLSSNVERAPLAGALSLRRGNRSTSASAFHLVLHRAGPVMAPLDRLVGLLDHLPSLRRELAVLQRGFVLGLDVVLTTLDFLDDRLVAVAHDRLLEVHVPAVRRGGEAARIL